MLPDTFLDALITELDDEATVAIALFGSHARGEATRYSDVDLVRFATALPAKESERYTLQYRDNHLVSVSVTTIADKRDGLARPQEAIWVVPALRQARILLDKEGALAKLKQEAGAFTWEPLRAAADEYASYDVMGYAEEVHKILSALTKRDESAVLYGTVGLLFGLTRAVAVQRGILIESENSYLRQVQESVGRDSVWTRYHRLAAGFEIGATNRSPAEVRGIAGLALYEETVCLLRHILHPAHLDVIDHTLTAIRESELARLE